MFLVLSQNNDSGSLQVCRKKPFSQHRLAGVAAGQTALFIPQKTRSDSSGRPRGCCGGTLIADSCSLLIVDGQEGETPAEVAVWWERLVLTVGE